MSVGKFAAPSKPLHRAGSINLRDSESQPVVATEKECAIVLAQTIDKLGPNNTAAMMLGLIPSPPRMVLDASLTVAICLSCGWESAPTLAPNRDLNGHMTAHRKDLP